MPTLDQINVRFARPLRLEPVTTVTVTATSDEPNYPYLEIAAALRQAADELERLNRQADTDYPERVAFSLGVAERNLARAIVRGRTSDPLGRRFKPRRPVTP